MEGFAVGDVRLLLDIVAELHDDPGPEPVPLSVLRRIQQLLDADSAGGFVDHHPGRPVTEWVTRPAPWWLAGALREVGEQDPVHRVHCRDVREPVSISDRLSEQDFQRRDIYRRVCEPLHVADSLRLYLSPGRDGRFVFFDRSRRGFSPRARTALALLRPHLVAALDRRSARSSLSKDARLTRRQREVLALVAAGRRNAEIADQLSVSEATVRKHLENVYERLGVHSRTAAVARAGLVRRSHP